MMSLDQVWNIRKLTQSGNMVTVDISPRLIGCVETCVKVLANAADILKDQQVLGSEMFVLSRLLFKRKAQIRRHKSRQVLTQVETCLKRYQETDLPGLVKTMYQHFQQAKMKQQTGSVVRLPSCSMFQYLLVRLMGVAALLVQTVNYCVNATLVLETDVKLAHLLPHTMLCLATTSRIWACCRSLYLDCMTWYHALVPVLQSLPQGTGMLAEDERLPTDLMVWLEHRVYLDNMKKEPCLLSGETDLSSVETMSDPPSHDNPRLRLKNEPEEESEDVTTTAVKRNMEEDIGAPVKIAREDLGIKYETVSPQKSRKKKVKKKMKKDSSQITVPNTKAGGDNSDTVVPPGTSFSVPFIKTEAISSDEDMAEKTTEKDSSDYKAMEQQFSVRKEKTETKITAQSMNSEETFSGQTLSKTRKKTTKVKTEEDGNSGKSFSAHLIKAEQGIPDTSGQSASQYLNTEDGVCNGDISRDQPFSTHCIKQEHPSTSNHSQSVKQEGEMSGHTAVSTFLTHPHGIKQLKQEISEAENMRSLLDIFVTFKPGNTRTSTVWDEWPRVNQQRKKELFEIKWKLIQKCKSKSKKVKSAEVDHLAKAKKHIFTYLKEINETNSTSVAEIMNAEKLKSVIEELESDKLTWHDETKKLSPRKAQILRLKLESLLRKMLKVKVANKTRLTALKEQAGHLVTRYMRQVADSVEKHDRSIKTEDVVEDPGRSTQQNVKRLRMSNSKNINIIKRPKLKKIKQDSY